MDELVGTVRWIEEITFHGSSCWIRCLCRGLYLSLPFAFHRGTSAHGRFFPLENDPICSWPLYFIRFWYCLSIDDFESILLFGSHRFKIIIELDVFYIFIVYVFHAILFLICEPLFVACYCLHLICGCLVLGRCGSRRLCFAYWKIAWQ